MKKETGIKCGMCCALLALCGCETPVFDTGYNRDNSSRRVDPSFARLANNTQQMQIDVQQMREQVAEVQRRNDALSARVDRLEAQGNGEDLASIRRDIQLLRSERDTLKRDIANDLAARIDKAAATTRAAAQPPMAAPRQAAAKAVAGAKAAATAAHAGYEHTVQKGQTLSEIARGYGKSVNAIMKANKIRNPASIRVGQVLFIPD